jgi:nucleoside-triphosphatase THEP1
MTSFSERDLDPLWMRAALLGSIWASSEIILGSFLHNMGIPFTGTLLAAIGTALVVAGSEVWGGRGLLWRSGLVCALMKSVSPSAVILGPMIGIMLEAGILEVTVRLLGRNLFAYILGGMLAVTTPLLQKLVGLLIVYGWDMARLYVSAFDAGARYLGITALGPVDVLFIVAVLHGFIGVIAAVTGYVAGRRAIVLPEGPVQSVPPGAPGPTDGTLHQRYSLILLAVNIAAVAGTLTAMSLIPLWLAAAITLAYGGAVWTCYPVVRTRLSRWRLWAEIVVVSVLAGVVLGDLPGGEHGGSLVGALAGIHMALRAALVVSAFSAISVELRNPAVVDWFLRHGMGKLAAAVEVAFGTLPLMIKTLGEQRKFLREPLDSVVRLIGAGRDWLRDSCQLQRHCVYVLSGDRGSGKTRLLTAITETLLMSGKNVGGILSPVVQSQESRLGYDVLDLQSGRQVPLCRRDIEPTGGSTGPFRFDAGAIRFGNAALAQAATSGADLIILDEVGPLEFDGRGWAEGLEGLLQTYHGSLLLVVRPNLLGRLTERWPLSPVRTWDVRETDRESLTRELLKLLGRRRPGSPPA